MQYVFLVLTCFAVGAHATGEKLSISLQQSGFHRNLHYVTYFLQPWRPESCDFCLEQTIPSGAYVDTDQLDDLARFDKINYFCSENVNIEAMASKSRPFQVYLYGDTTSLYTIELPIHFRYQLPGNKSFVKVAIESPRMFVYCSAKPTADEHFPDNQNSTFQFRCRNSSHLCEWQEVDYEMHSDAIFVNIPVGSAILEPIVTIMTIAVSWIACYFVVKAMITKSRELKQRM